MIIHDNLNIEYPKVYKGNKNPEKKINDDIATNSVGYLDKNGIKYSNSINVQNLYIVTLDIDGNINLYNEGQEKVLFNLYNLSTIEKDYKEKQFFSMGYAYYIKTNLHYFCISSDHGCFIIKGEEN